MTKVKIVIVLSSIITSARTPIINHNDKINCIITVPSIVDFVIIHIDIY